MAKIWNPFFGVVACTSGQDMISSLDLKGMSHYADEPGSSKLFVDVASRNSDGICLIPGPAWTPVECMRSRMRLTRAMPNNSISNTGRIIGDGIDSDSSISNRDRMQHH